MIVTTTYEIGGREVVESIGLVRGSTVRARHLGKDITAVLKNVVGGEIDAQAVRRARISQRRVARPAARDGRDWVLAREQRHEQRAEPAAAEDQRAHDASVGARSGSAAPAWRCAWLHGSGRRRTCHR